MSQLSSSQVSISTHVLLLGIFPDAHGTISTVARVWRSIGILAVMTAPLPLPFSCPFHANWWCGVRTGAMEPKITLICRCFERRSLNFFASGVEQAKALPPSVAKAVPIECLFLYQRPFYARIGHPSHALECGLDPLGENSHSGVKPRHQHALLVRRIVVHRQGQTGWSEPCATRRERASEEERHS